MKWEVEARGQPLCMPCAGGLGGWPGQGWEWWGFEWGDSGVATFCREGEESLGPGRVWGVLSLPQGACLGLPLCVQPAGGHRDL